MEKEKNSLWYEAHRNICHTWSFMACTCMAASESKLLFLFAVDMTADGSKIKSDVYGAVLFTHSAKCCKFNRTALHSVNG